MTYWVLKVLLSPFFFLFWRIKVEGRAHVPAKGPVILAPNHVAFLDSMFLPPGVAPARHVRGQGRVLRLVEDGMVLPCRGPDPHAARGRERIGAGTGRRRATSCESGRALGIYPEGTRSPDGRLYRGHTGVARLALGCGVPVIPVGMVGTSTVQRPGSNLPRPFKRVTVRFGAPLDLSRFERHQASDPLTLRAATDELMFEIRHLSGQEYVDRYAKRHGVVGGADVAQVRPSANGDGYGPAPVPPLSPEPAGATSEPAA